MEDCLFCKIVKQDEVPSSKIYEDEDVYAFLDIRPTNPGHTLVVPKQHFVNLYDMSEESLYQVMSVVKKLAPKIKEAMGAGGINIHMNNDPAAGQVIFHSHIHIIPRFENDGHRLWGGKPYKEGEMDKVAQKILKEL